MARLGLSFLLCCLLDLVLIVYSFEMSALPKSQSNDNSLATAFENPRILGGVDAKPGQFPSVISLHSRHTNPKNNKTSFEHDCGGAIADENHVLTAGHCVWNKKADDLLIIAGAHSIKKEEESQQRVNVIRIVLHPNYTAKDDAGPYDIAILKLGESLKLNERVGKAEMAKKNKSAEGQCYNAGWGNQFPFSPMHYQGSETMKTGKTSMIAAEECQAAYPSFKTKLETAICARAGAGRGTCQGDSGGPLFCTRDNVKYLAGLVSFGFKVCNNGFHPDVYTDMSHPAIWNFVDTFTKTGEVVMAKTEDLRSGSNSMSSSSSRSSNKGLSNTFSNGQKPLSFG